MVAEYDYLICIDGNCVAGTANVSISDEKIELETSRATVILIKKGDQQ